MCEDRRVIVLKSKTVRWVCSVSVIVTAALTVIAAGCARRHMTPSPKPSTQVAASAPTEKELGIPLFPGAVVQSFKRSSGRAGTAPDIAVTLVTARPAGEVARFYREKLGKNTYSEHVFDEDNAKVIALWAQSGGVRKEITITEDFETGKTTIDLFKGAATEAHKTDTDSKP